MIIIPSIIERIATRKDNTLVISIATNEISPNKVGLLMTLHNKMGYVAINEEKFTGAQEKAISELKTDIATGKTPAQRMRSTLYVLFTQDNCGFTDFDQFYSNRMELMITQIKDKLI